MHVSNIGKKNLPPKGLSQQRGSLFCVVSKEARRNIPAERDLKISLREQSTYGPFVLHRPLQGPPAPL